MTGHNMENVSPDTTPLRSISHPFWTAPLWIALFVLLACLLQWYISYPVDDDTAYHFTVGQLIRKYGILQSFPWTPFSLQFDHYADKEFLFHLLFAPLGGLGFVTAARIVGALGSALILSSLYLVLRAERVRHAGLWALLPLACSEFIFRIALVRPHLLSITLAILLLWAYARERRGILAAVSVIFPLSYVAFWQIPLIIIFSTETARLLSGERIRWKPAAIVVCGLAAGVALHPNSLNLIGINWLHMSDILFQGAWGARIDLNLGTEFAPFPPATWVKHLAVTVLCAGAALILGWRERRNGFFPFACALTALVFGLLTVRTLRFIEYFAPFTALAIALVSPGIRVKNAVFGICGVSLVYLLTLGTGPIRTLAPYPLDLKKEYIAPETARYFENTIPVGSQVFTCGWDYTGNLMLALPERRFIVAADPTMLYKKDPLLYGVWSQIPLLPPVDSAEQIRRNFNSRFVICLNYEAYWNFFDALQASPGVRNLSSGKKWVLFDLGAERK